MGHPHKSVISHYFSSFYFWNHKQSRTMGTKRKFKAKRSLSSLPKGLVHRQGKAADPGNPFEISGRQKGVKQKHLVHNRPVSKPKSTEQALESLQRRQSQLRSNLKSTKKANVFVDKRIGQYDSTMSRDDQMLARLVKERSRQSHRASKFRLDDDDNNILTHKGSRLDPNKTEQIYSDDEDDYRGQLEAVDTELHFGGSGLSSKQADPYGGSSNAALSQVYGQRKTELDDLILRRKIQKAERMQVKEAQVDTIEKMDETFAELSQLLSYRKNQKVKFPRKHTKEDEEMKEWNLEMKEMMMKPKRKATDRTKTPEEIAKNEAERLHELETRRMARMNGDFEEDDFSDISVSEYQNKKKKKSKKKSKSHRNPEELSDSDDDRDDEPPKAVFTADGLQYIDKEGRPVKGKETSEEDSDSEDESSNSEDDDASDVDLLAEGTRVQGNYHAGEQFDTKEVWYDGVIRSAQKQPDGSVTYDVDYDDGDFEEGMIPEHVRPIAKTEIQKTKQKEKTEEELEEKFRRNKARVKARYVKPLVILISWCLFRICRTREHFLLLFSYTCVFRDPVWSVLLRHFLVDFEHTPISIRCYIVPLRRFLLSCVSLATTSHLLLLSLKKE
jgi:nucleolar protein 14